MIMTCKWLILIVSLSFSGILMAADNDLLPSADKLLKSGKAKEAYELLVPHQSDLAGDPAYDYMLGISALDSGKANEAIFAFERVLAVNPNHLQARAEIARAYFTTGETAAAQQEFETVQKQNPPKEVNLTIQKFLDAIGRARAGEKTTVKGFLEAAIGDDSNINSATSSSQIAIPLFGGGLSVLSANGVKLHDTYYSVGAGINVRHPLSPEWSVFGGANFNQHMNASKDIFDTKSMDGSLGANLTKGDDNYSAILQTQTFSVDNNRYRDANGLTAQWMRNLDGSSQASAYLQYSDLSYPGQDNRNADRYVLGAAYARALGGEYTPVIFVGGYAGEEAEQKPDVPWNGHKLYGVRAGGEMKLNPQTTLFASASLEERHYGGQDPFFLIGRKDTQIDIRGGVSYVPVPGWTITPQVSYTRNDSNIILNDYDRTVINVSLRRDFN